MEPALLPRDHDDQATRRTAPKSVGSVLRNLRREIAHAPATKVVFCSGSADSAPPPTTDRRAVGGRSPVTEPATMIPALTERPCLALFVGEDEETTAAALDAI